MKTTIDIPDDVLEDAMRLTNTSSKRDAVVGAMTEFIRRKKVEALLQELGTSTTFMTQQQLSDMRAGGGKYESSR